MNEPLVIVVAIVAFLVAGIVKGVIGLGLPTVGIGILSLVLTPAEAAVLLVVPTVVTNVWQLLIGPGLRPLLRRLWPMLGATCLVTFAAAGLLAADPTGRAAAALGAALAIYAIAGLSAVRFAVPPRTEPWLGPLVGATSGLIAGATGVFSIPGVIYLNGLGLQKDELIQALGLTFTFAMLALAAGLWRVDAFHTSVVGASLFALAPALAGMGFGQWIRTRISPEQFRTCFFLGLLVLGAHLALRNFM
jgi:uncharacterized membrane protein YfcA